MDAKAILDVLMQSGMGQSQRRLERASSGNNPLLDIAGSLLGGGGGSGGGGALGGMLSQVLGGGASANQGAGGGLGDVLGSLLGGGGQSAGGGLAGGLIGSLAKAAMSQMAGGASGGSGGGFDLSQFSTGEMESQRDDNDRALVMIRAMLTAAKADGKIDAGEQQRILGKLNDAGATNEMRQFIQSELQKPVDIDSIVSEVDSPHMATEVYTASLFAIDVDTPGEQAYMNQLSSRLGLPSTLVKQLHDSLEVRGA